MKLRLIFKELVELMHLTEDGASADNIKSIHSVSMLAAHENEEDGSCNVTALMPR